MHKAGTFKRMMAAHFLLQFLLFGTLLAPAYLQMEECNFLQNVPIESNFSVTVTPEEYMANTSYQGKPSFIPLCLLCCLYPSGILESYAVLRCAQNLCGVMMLSLLQAGDSSPTCPLLIPIPCLYNQPQILFPSLGCFFPP